MRNRCFTSCLWSRSTKFGRECFFEFDQRWLKNVSNFVSMSTMSTGFSLMSIFVSWISIDSADHRRIARICIQNSPLQTSSMYRTLNLRVSFAHEHTRRTLECSMNDPYTPAGISAPQIGVWKVARTLNNVVEINFDYQG